MPYTGTIDGPYLMRQYLGLPSVNDIQQGGNIPLALNKRNIISGSGATVTLTAAQSGSSVLFDRAAGIVFTLPVPQIGLHFRFFATVAVTSNAYKIITDAGTTLLLGNVVSNTAAATPGANDGPKTFAANGTSHIAISMSGSTTGGLIGSYIDMTCVSATAWTVNGVLLASGIIATPFSAS
jgi:hypothetical protein